MTITSRIRYPNRKERRMAYRTSSLSRYMDWGILHKTKIAALSDNIFKANPIFEWLNKS